MKLGVNTFLFASPFTTGKLKVLDTVAATGFDSVEIALENPEDFDTTIVKERLDNLGLECCAVCGVFGAGRDLRGTPEEQIAAREFIVAGIDTAAALGCSLFVGPMYSRTGRARLETAKARHDQQRLVTENLQSVCTYAAEKNVNLAVEVMNRFATDFLNTTAQALDLLDRVESPMLGVHLDTFHMNIEEKSIQKAVVAAGDRLFHLHVADNDRSAPGQGSLDWTGLGHALKTIDYRNSVVIESFMPDALVAGTVPSVWRPLAASGNDLARDGLVFLRKLFESQGI